MSIIKLNDIDRSALKKLSSQGTMSTVYEDGVYVYKFLNSDGLTRRKIAKKLLSMEDLEIDGALLPKDLIMQWDTELKNWKVMRLYPID